MNYATKFAKKVDDAITIDAYTGKNLNTDYEFSGVKTVKIYSIETVDLNGYTRSGTSRYGTPVELDDTVQEMTVAQDMAFTYTIDKGNDAQQMNVKGAAASLKRQIAEKVIPWLDKFRFAIIAENIQTGYSDSTALDKTNVYAKFLAGTEKLADEGVTSGLVAYMKPSAFNLLKQDSSFVKSGDLSQRMLLKGQVGECDGVAIVVVGGNRLPKGVDFIIIQNKAMVSPMVLRDYKIHNDAPGIDGALVEGRILFDAFILGSRKKAMYMQGARTSAITFTNAASYKTVATGIDVYCDEKVYYKVAASGTAPTIGNAFTTTGYTEATTAKGKALNLEVTGTSTNVTAIVVVVDRDGNVRDAKAQTLTA